jgi:hypothetical protein
MVPEYPSPNNLQWNTCYEYRHKHDTGSQGTVVYKCRHLFKNVNYATDVNLKATEWVISTSTWIRSTKCELKWLTMVLLANPIKTTVESEHFFTAGQETT